MSRTPDVRRAVSAFVQWLDSYGEESYDHQTFFAGPVGGRLKALYYRRRALGTLAVAPLIACEAFLPSARRLFWKPQRFPIADAHYASAFAFLAATDQLDAHYRRAVHFLEALINSRSAGRSGDGWGYPFDWVTMRGTIAAGTPLITTLPYVYEAFDQVHRLDSDPRWLDVMRSIANHAVDDYAEHPTSARAASCSYTPDGSDTSGVVNASAYRAFLLAHAAQRFDDPRYLAAAQRSLHFVLESQNGDGSWPYARDQRRHFVDHFHTCFVLKALAKIQRLPDVGDCEPAIARGVDYYVRHLFDATGLPKPFSERPRLTVYRRELYDYAECINVGVLLQGRFPHLDTAVSAAVRDVLDRWQKPDGSFRARELLFGWDSVPMHRWAQAQLFRSLTFSLHTAGAA